MLEQQARALNPGYVRRISGGLPYVRCKLAMSLDGRAAMRDGTSKWITSEQARRDAQFLRARSDAILTGSGTVRFDNPLLNVRLKPEDFPCVTLRAGGASAAARGARLQPADDSRCAHAQAAGQDRWCCARASIRAVPASWSAAGAQVVQLQDAEGRIYLRDALAYLGDRDINEVLIEAGPRWPGRRCAKGPSTRSSSTWRHT